MTIPLLTPETLSYYGNSSDALWKDDSNVEKINELFHTKLNLSPQTEEPAHAQLDLGALLEMNWTLSNPIVAYSLSEPLDTKTYKTLSLTSKTLNLLATDCLKKYIEENFFKLKEMGLKTLEQALSFTSRQQLTQVNLSGYQMTQANLEQLKKNRQIQNLSISVESENITIQEDLQKALPNLQRVEITSFEPPDSFFGNLGHLLREQYMHDLGAAVTTTCTSLCLVTFIFHFRL